MRLLASLALTCLLMPLAQAAEPHHGGLVLESPNGLLTVTFTLNGEGRPGYRVDRQGQPIIAESRLGFLLSDGPKLERNFMVESSERSSFDETWEQPWGERRWSRNHYNELNVGLRERGGLGRRLEVTFRAFDDGIGFRYRFPEQEALQQVNIAEELTEFHLARPATAWWIPAGEWNRYEYLYARTPVEELSRVHTPVTFRFEDGTHLALHEAALVDYSGMWLQRVEGRRLRAELAPAAEGPKVSRAAPFTTPWRTLQVASTAGGLYESDLVLNLNEPNALGDVSWVEPYKYVGVWWSLHLDTESWASGERHGATTANVRRYIDFAAEHGFRGVLVEGWNEGWDGDWFANGQDFSFTRAYPDYDLEGLARYAREKGVRLIGHHETSGHVAHYEAQLGDALDLAARLGIDSIKTGYVADAGGAKVAAPDGRLLHEWHDGQALARHHLTVVKEAAKRQIAINPHEPIKDTGLRRTYPNWVSREGARGQEYDAWGVPPNPPSHVPTLVFTRMLSGPMDYTPGVLSLTGRHGARIQSTLARQLALYVVVYSPIQMAADLPEHYERFPRPFQFIKDVPVDWQETRVLSASIGEHVVMARRDRAGDDWYLGGVNDDQAREVEVALDFLEPGRRYQATLYRDGAEADWQDAPEDLVIETREARRGDRWRLRMGAGGGFAVRLKALDPYAPGQAVEVTPPDWSRDAVMYQVNLRQFTPEGTLQAAVRQLPRLQALGVDILWLMPIHPIGEKNRKGSLGSPYSVRDYYGVNPEFGSLDDLRRFIDEAHRLGMKVILDWVANHSAWDNPLVESHPEWYERDWKGAFHPTSWWDWSDIIEFDYSQPGLRRYMTEAMKYWVGEVGVDGFRADVAGYVPLDFWEQLRRELDAIKPVFMLAESNSRDLHYRAFEATYGWGLHTALHAVTTGGAGVDALAGHYSEQDNLFPAGSMRLVFTSNHDENAWKGTEFELFGDGVAAAIALTFVGDGIPVIYNGQEAGNPKRLAFFERDPIEWGTHPHADLFRRLAELKSRNTALHNGPWGARMIRVTPTSPQHVLAFVRQNERDKVLGVFNFSASVQRIGLVEELAHGDYTDFTDGTGLRIAADTELVLEPWEYRILLSP
ncbi:MAG: glycoside hydrolase family 97 catalytic domain-containing protein [Steroidobacteraceae bacterium]